MGKFTEGYEIGVRLQNDDYDENQYAEDLKKLLQTSTYNEFKEWYNGFHKGMLDVDLANLEKAFMALKEQAEESSKQDE